MPEPQSTKQLIVIAGPTAVGKTSATIKLAQYLKCPILSSDARQCYKELGVAVAKPTVEELGLVKHYFINSHSIFQPVSAADFEIYGLEVLKEVFANHDYCVVSGGSGLYVKALCEGLDEMPAVSKVIKQDLQDRWQKDGLNPLLKELQELDALFYNQVDLANHRRVIRALEICLATGRPFSEFRTGGSKPRPFNIIKVALTRERDEIYHRIDQRMDDMIAKNLFQEAKDLYEHRNLVPLLTVGYQEVFAHLEGKYGLDETIRLLKRNSRRYAKRQLTWFKKDTHFNWIEADDWIGLQTFVKSCLGVKDIHHSQ